MVNIVEIYVHWYAGRSKNQLATSLGVDRKTIRKYVTSAEAAGMAPGGPPMSEADWAKLIKSGFPELGSWRLKQLTWPEIEEHRDLHLSATGDQHGHRDPPTTQGRKEVEGITHVAATVGAREPPRGGDPVEGDGAAGRCRARLGSPDRLRLPGVVDQPEDRQTTPNLGLRNGGALLTAHVRTSRDTDGPACVDPGPHGLTQTPPHSDAGAVARYTGARQGPVVVVARVTWARGSLRAGSGAGQHAASVPLGARLARVRPACVTAGTGSRVPGLLRSAGAGRDRSGCSPLLSADPDGPGNWRPAVWPRPIGGLLPDRRPLGCRVRRRSRGPGWRRAGAAVGGTLLRGVHGRGSARPWRR